MNPRVASHRAQRRLIDDHFAARITPGDESALRAHLPGCQPCRAYYERHMLYAHLVPGRPRLAARLGAGLGVAPAAASASVRAPARWSWAVTGAAAAACVALLVISRAGQTPAEFGPRGLAADGTGVALEVYRVTGDRSTRVSDGWMSARDELAFAYRNPTGFARLLVFGVDDRGGIYWFHPAWTDARQDPEAVPIAAGTGPFELAEAIGHEIRGSRLRVVALFTNTAVSVRSVEDAWRNAQPDPPGSLRLETSLEVRP